jgi:chorismate synthase
MAGNSFGDLLRITSFGESHGPGLGVVVDGCPPGVPLTIEMFNAALARRRPGQSKITTDRNEPDTAVIQSGMINGKSTGAPIGIWIENQDARPQDYTEIATTYRPSHSDYTYEMKYGVRAPSGGGRSSARETVARVAAGVVAMSILTNAGIRIQAFVIKVHQISIDKDWSQLDLGLVESNAVRCPDPEVAARMERLIMEAKAAGDSVGGVIQCVVQGCPPGLGEPVFDKLHADLGKAILSINACKGVSFGSGFEGTSMMGSEHNDAFVSDDEGRISTTTNFSGGIQGGISNGMPIVIDAAFKPTSTIRKPQQSVDSDGNQVTLEAKGRHDPCVLPRAVPIVEAMVALVLADHLLKMRIYQNP